MSSHFDESPDARSMTISSADLETHGVSIISRCRLVSELAKKVVNRQSRYHPSFRVGLSENRGTRRTMEDAHSFVVDFDSIRGQGFFAVFDGHAGKYAAEWCGSHFHQACIAHRSRFLNNPLSSLFYPVCMNLQCLLSLTFWRRRFIKWMKACHIYVKNRTARYTLVVPQ